MGFNFQIMERFWRKVKIGTKEECWEWSGSRNNGYGQMRIGKVIKKAHRISWKIHFGEIPKGFQVCHKCDNRRCINPDHLFIGTNSTNQIDSANKGRNNGQKLLPKNVLKIRSLLNKGVPVKIIQGEFPVGQPMISKIKSHKTWSHLI